MRILIATALVAAMASPALAQSAPVSSGRQYGNTLGTPQKPTTWTAPSAAPQPAQPAAHQPEPKKRPSCGAAPMGGGTSHKPVRC